MLRRLRIALLLLLALALMAALCLLDLHRQLNLPLKIDGDTVVTIDAGERLRAVLRKVEAQGAFANRRQPLYLELYARYRGETGIKAGDYQLKAGMTSLDLLSDWLAGRTLRYELRIVEGIRFATALKLILEHPKIRRTLATDDPGAAMRAIGQGDRPPEGAFFPDTYLFERDTPDVVILQRGFDAMQRALDEEWQSRDPSVPYANPQEALIMASIIEKETGVAAERPTIAGVFVRRLALGMKLQTDPTVIYGLGESFDGNLRRRDLLADQPFNTYLRSGLPPSPICLPGRAALHAALHPEAGDALYFVARGDGTHQFSATFEEHEAAVRKYQIERRQ